MLIVRTGQFGPKSGGQFPAEQVVSLNRNRVVNFSEISNLGPDGNLVFGNAGLKFRVIGTKKRVDSLLALKADLIQLALYQTKALLQQDLTPTASGYPSVNAVIGGLNTKANATDLTAYQAKSEKGQSNGYAGLDGSGKVPLTQINDALLGAVNYRGTYNAATNSPALPAAASSNKGYYYIVSTAGTQFGLDFRVGDWIISNGSAYGKVASSSDVESVNGKKGVIALGLNDILSQSFTSELPISVGAVAAGSGSISSAPTQPTHIVRLSDLSAYQPIATAVTSVAGKTGAVTLNKYDVQLGNVDNTSDILKPVSNPTNAALNLKADKSEIAAGQTIGANTTGNAATATSATRWGNTTADFNALGTGSVGYIVGYDTSLGTVKPFAAAPMKTFLSTSFQDVTTVGSSTANNISVGNVFQVGGNATIRRFSDSEIRIGDASDWRMTFLNGNVGIGTISPQERLTVSNGKLALTTEDATIGGKIYGYVDGGVYPYAGGLKFQTRNFTGSTYEYLDRLTINAFGTMTLAGSAQIDNDMTFGYSGQTNSIGSREVGQVLNVRGSGSLNLQTYDTDWRSRLSINNVGNIGIGTTSPTDKLTVAGNIQAASGRIRADLNAQGSSLILTGNNSNFIVSHDGSNIVNIENSAGGGFSFSGSARVSSNDGSSNAVARNIDLQGKANLIGGNSFLGNGVQNFINTGDTQRTTISPGTVSNTSGTYYAALGTTSLGISSGTNTTTYNNGFINSNVTGSALSFDLPTVSGRLLTGFKSIVTLDFPNVGASQNVVLSRTVANVALNDVVTIALPNSIMSNMTNWNGSFKAWVSAANTISFMFQNLDPAAPHDLPETSFTIFVQKQ